jgi:lipopolysaccharide transport system permease protein
MDLRAGDSVKGLESTPVLPVDAAPLPEEPTIVIEASNSPVAFNIRALWAYRELLYFLAWRDVKVRYKQTLLGAAWAILQPLLTMLIFTFIFSRVAKIDSNGIPYPIFAYSALLPWTFFSNAITTSGNSVVGSSHLITKVYFPRLIIPVAAVCAGLVDLIVAFPMLIALMIYYHIGLSLNILAAPALVLLTTLLAITVGTWLSAINVKYRDVKFAIPFLIQIWMYLSPVVYPLSAIPPRWRIYYSLNPVVGLISGYRSAFFGSPFDRQSIAISLLVTLVFFVYASRQFRKMEKSFADII